jgi:Gluconate 2-dehydrogenase subunit 3
MSKTTRREFLKFGLAAAGSALAASAVEIPLLSDQYSSVKNQLNTATSQLTTANQQVASLKSRVNSMVGFVSLSINEQALLEPVVETIIPSDSTGVGAKEAGVIYFIDRQLGSEYGFSANMFMDAPHIPPNIAASSTTPLKVNPSLAWAFLKLPSGAYSPAGGGGSANALSYTGGSQTYNAGGTAYTVNYGITASPRVGSGINYQYPMNMREFWRVGLAALQTYSNKAYGGNFQTLSSANQLLALQDLWANKPKTSYATSDDLTGFSNILPSDFAYELTFMTWAGFLMDPIYGGNQNMVGWDYVGYNGVNFGNFYGEGLSQKTLMVASSPTKLKPASLAQYQQQATGGGA